MDSASFITPAPKGATTWNVLDLRGEVPLLGEYRGSPVSRCRGDEQCFPCFSCMVAWTQGTEEEDSDLQHLQCKGCSLCCQ